jgi:alanine racemase
MEISLDAIDHNLSIIRNCVGPDRTIIATLKGDAYGHGIVETARALCAAGTDFLAVDSGNDARAIRTADVPTPILILGEWPPDHTLELALAGFIPTVGDWRALAALPRGPNQKKIFIKVDCGFGRFGIPLEQARRFVNFANAQESVDVVGLYTHLPFSHPDDRKWAEDQLRQFEALVGQLLSDGIRIPVTQALASTGIVTGMTDNLSAIAVGHLLFGLSPVTPELDHLFEGLELRSALNAIRTTLVHVGRRPENGNSAPYLRGGVSTTGVVPIGLAHGYPSAAQGRTAKMILRNRQVPVLRVCLSSTVLDLSETSDAQVGDEVLVLGESKARKISIETMARWQGASVLSALTRLGGGIPHYYFRTNASTTAAVGS